MQCGEKVFAPYLFFCFAHLSHLNVSDHQTNLNMTQRNCILCLLELSDDFIFWAWESNLNFHGPM
jgi:hypothetical protein